MPKTQTCKSDKTASSNSLTLIEQVDTEKVIELLFAKEKIDRQSFYTLVKYLQSDGQLRVNYKTSDRDIEKKGRLYAEHGFQSLKKWIRDYLARDSYLDLDLTNCSPRILREYCDRYRIPCPRLVNYICEREKWIDQIPEIKQIVLERICDPYRKIPSSQRSPRVLYSLLQEITELVQKVIDCAGIILDDPSLIGSTISTLIQERERELVDWMIAKCREEEIRVVTVVFDGLIIERVSEERVAHLLNSFDQQFGKYHSFMVKVWCKQPIEMYERQYFDHLDPILFKDLNRFQQVIFDDPIHCLYTLYSTIVRTVRTVNWDCFYLKNGERRVAIKKKLELSFQIRSSKRKTSLTEICRMISNALAVDSVTYYRANPSQFSLFPGFLPDLSQSASDPEKWCQPLLKHIYEVWAAENREIYEFTLDFLSFIVQHFPKKTESLLLFNGDEGTGKSMIADFLCDKIFGTTALTVTGCEKVTRNFNSHLAGKVLVIMEEMADSDSNFKTNMNRIKHIITSTRLDIERKGIDVTSDEQGINLIAFSNYQNPFPPVVGINRRLVQSEVSQRYKGNSEYFKQLGEWLEHPVSPSSFLRFLFDRKIDYHRLRYNKPLTDSKLENIWSSLNDVDKALYILRVLYDRESDESTAIRVTATRIQELIKRFFNRNPPVSHIGRRLTRLGIDQKTYNGRRLREISQDYSFDPELLRVTEKWIDNAEVFDTFFLSDDL